MKAISIRQPWAWLIVRPDLDTEFKRMQNASEFKDVENRTWSTKYRGPILIHAAKGMSDGEYDIAKNFAALQNVTAFPCPSELQRGGIIGVAELYDCVDWSSSVWFSGPFGFLLRNAKPLRPFECKGALGLFEVDDGLGIVSEARKALGIQSNR